MQNYPGDFSASSTFGILSPFLQSLLPNGATWVAHYALELIPLLPSISNQIDPEASWALPDKDVAASPDISARDAKLEVSQSRRPSIAPSYDSANSQNAANLSVPLSNDGSMAQSAVLSPRTASDAGTFDTQDSGDQGQSLGASSSSSVRPRGGLGASFLIDVSNMVAEMREEEVALQITRLAWEMFGGMTVIPLPLSCCWLSQLRGLIKLCDDNTAARPLATRFGPARSGESSCRTPRFGNQRHEVDRFRQRATQLSLLVPR